MKSRAVGDSQERASSKAGISIRAGWRIVAENAISPLVIDRKAWLFSNSQRGATASTNVYSLIKTAKANQMEPYQYHFWLFKRLPVTEEKDIYLLLPWNMPINNG